MPSTEPVVVPEKKKAPEEVVAESKPVAKRVMQSGDRIDVRYDDFLSKIPRSPPRYTSSFLRPGSTFMGSQQSGRHTYEVHVELKRVDMERATLCGYLHIEGLTEDHPTLITYFEGEMISDEYSFFTQRADWGASPATDITHWSRFAPWRAIADKAKHPSYVHRNYDQRAHIFMRWKECFLVPDYRVRDIHGASYAGFYYICFDQLNGSISGFYFHQKSDKYQQLELTHVADSGRAETYELR
uniref:ARAD1B11836p n=1 Tax=Blastobotrys adeninivorans TaxID=409370 RepID=A0A060T6G0_BLAAD